MATPDNQARVSRLTPKGEATRARILQAAADLMHANGVGFTTMDDVRAASGTSKSQLYRHFPDKDALVHEVINLQAQGVLERHQRHLQRLRSFRGLELWRDALVQRNALRGGAYGCELGSLANELSDTDDQARVSLAEHFQVWEGLLAEGLQRMKDAGALSEDADPRSLATALMAAVQGGYLLAQVSHDATPMAVALDMALDHVRTFAAGSPQPNNV